MRLVTDDPQNEKILTEEIYKQSREDDLENEEGKLHFSKCEGKEKEGIRLIIYLFDID